MGRSSRRLGAASTAAVLVTLATAPPVAAAPPRVVFVGTEATATDDQGIYASTVTGVSLSHTQDTGADRRPIVTTPGHHRQPDVSPDGTRLVYVHAGNLWLANLDGSDRRQLTTFQGPGRSDEMRPRFSPDGRFIAYGHHDGRIHVFDTSSAADRPLVPGRTPSWSPDGTRIAFAGGELAGVGVRGPRELRSMAADGTDVRTLHRQDEGFGITDVSWSPDGELIAFVRSAGYHSYAPDHLASSHVRYISSVLGPVQHVAESEGARTVNWSDDGSVVVYERWESGGEYPRIYTNTLDGRNRRNVEYAFSHEPLFLGNAPGTIPAQGGFDADPGTTERLDAATPTAAAVAASRLVWSDKHGVVAPEADRPALPRATYAVLSRDDTFADSLAGAALTFRGPLLFTRTAELSPETRAELRRILGPQGLVWVLGGDRAIAPAVVEQLLAEGFSVRRVEGPSRVETALRVADEVRKQFPNHARVLLARADGPGSAAWADSIAGGAYAADARIPLLLTPTDQLHPAVAYWMDRDRPSQTLLLGGTAALSDAVERAVPAPVRIAGPARDATGEAAAAALWKIEARGTRRYTIINGYDPDGWAWGIAGVNLADRADAPPLVVSRDTVPSATASAVTACRAVDLLVVGGTATIPQARVDELDARDQHC